MAIWTVLCIMGIIKNMEHYKAGDWIVILLIVLMPYIIYGIGYIKKTSTLSKATNFEVFASDLMHTQNIGTAKQTDGHVALEPIHNTISQQVENSNVTYIQSENTILRADGKSISDEEVPYLIETNYQRLFSAENDYKAGKRNLFTDNYLSKEEEIFFKCVHDEFSKAGLKPNLLKITRLSSGVLNVDYISGGYLGKVQISKKPEQFRVLRANAKKASRVFKTQLEAEEYINNKSDYIIDHIESRTIYFMQYFIGQKVHSDYVNSLQELIDLIPRWIKYIRYMKRNF